MRKNKVSNISVKSYMEIGSPWAPLFNLKYWVVEPKFITHDNLLF